MKALVERIRAEGRNLGRGILKVDGFINHQLDPDLTMDMGRHFARRFAAAGVSGVTKIITAEVSGIAPALTTGIILNIPIIYARKTRPITMPSGVFSAHAPSHTKGGIVDLIVSPEYLQPQDRVLLIDDFLATGLTIDALARLVAQCGATLCGIGCIVEKAFEGGRDRLAHLNVPIVSLAIIESMEGNLIVVRDPEEPDKGGSLIHFRATVGKDGDPLAHLIHQREIDGCRQQHFGLATLDEWLPPRVDHGGRAKKAAAICGPHTVARRHKTLVLDGPRPQQRPPVLAARMRPFGRENDQAGAIQRVATEQLRKAQVITDRQPGPAPGQIKHDSGVTRPQESLLVHQTKEVNLPVRAAEPAVRRVNRKAVVVLPAALLQQGARQIDAVFARQRSKSAKPAGRVRAVRQR